MKWFPNYVYECCLIYIFVQTAAETCHFPQPAQVSAAILLKAMLQVSNGETGHMGKMQVTCTWSMSPQFSQITQTVVVNDGQRKGQMRNFMVARLCFAHVKVCVARSIVSGGTGTPGEQPVNGTRQPPLHEFNYHDDHHARSRVKEIYVSLGSINLGISCSTFSYK